MTIMKKRRAKPHHPWLFIDEALLTHEQCVGEAIPNLLKQDVRVQRSTQIDNQRNLPHGDPNKKPDDFQFKLESSQHVFCTENPLSMPCYTLGERQVAAMKYENDNYIGKLIEAVDRDGRQRTINEVLTKDWIARNTTKEFRELLKAKQNVFIWVPVGAPRPNSYPYNYDKKLPKIAFPQENRDTCVTSSFASCLDAKLISDSNFQSRNCFRSLINFPVQIEQYGREYIMNPSNDQSKIIQTFCTMLRENHEFSKFFEIIKIDAATFDIWKLSQDDNTIYLLQLRGADGYVSHAVTVWKGMIFDSNLKFAVRLTQLNLKYCVDAVHLGIFCGYHFALRTIISKNNSKMKRKRRLTNKKSMFVKAKQTSLFYRILCQCCIKN